MKTTIAFFALLSCVILGNGQNSVTFLEPNCGTSIFAARSRIRGGNTADILEHPWMAFVSSIVACENPKPYTYCTSRCGGTLITNRFVLSAAHCTFNRDTTVQLGDTDVSSSSSNAIKINVVERISHPNYIPNDPMVKNDIALLRLADAVQYTASIKPICLPTNYDPLENTPYLTATGWGRTEYGVTSDILKTAIMSKLDRSSCSRWGVDMSQICAGDSNTNTCGGDSGGPITKTVNINGQNRELQLGIVSFGDKECVDVGAYTNVFYYKDWIAQVVGRNRPTHSPYIRPAPIQRTTTTSKPQTQIFYWSPYYPFPIYNNW